ncbi:zinc-finger domain-containing protein [Fructilactobacillus fructivorans]|nr:zinc-finger domain-containing protein [Fructilactobacillus fructivorans]MCT2867240.1 zinc-finger domain-containing protein [Fructilactobacillus fructivorans]MCT2868199.1 zinc-finger domain-containing protein [Fructilactobacillus fructivorans]MCT2872907.1 zinc-finger domain-containing protein [Fructilactobacillus fructivorans]
MQKLTNFCIKECWIGKLINKLSALFIC